MNNLLKGTRTYLVGQMQYCDGQPWRTYVEGELKKLGIVVLNPFNHPFINSVSEDNNATEKLKKLIEQGRYDEVSRVVYKIRCEDLRCCDICDFGFVYIDPKYHTCGAYEEIFWLNRLVKPIFFIVEGGKSKTPLWMFGTIPHKYIYDSIEDALTMLRNIDSGEVEIDSERWRLLRPEFR